MKYPLKPNKVQLNVLEYFQILFFNTIFIYIEIQVTEENYAFQNIDCQRTDNLAFHIYVLKVNTIQIMVHFLVKGKLFLTSCAFGFLKSRLLSFSKNTDAKIRNFLAICEWITINLQNSSSSLYSFFFFLKNIYLIHNTYSRDMHDIYAYI